MLPIGSRYGDRMRVGIVGFGVGGGALSVALAHDGHDVTVFEQTDSPGPVGAGFLLQPSGQAALGSLGLLDRVAAAAWPIRAFHAESASGRTLTLLRYDRRDPGSFALGVARGRLFTTLMEAATAAGVGVVTGVRVVDAQETREAVIPIDDLGASARRVRCPRRGGRHALGDAASRGSRLTFVPVALRGPVGPG